jgi:hypothetical protein
MVEIGLGAGLAALAFWVFIAAVSVASIWDGIRKREAKHETVRRVIESGQPIDQELMDKLLLQNIGRERSDRDFKIAGMWILPVSVGMAVFGLIMGSSYPQSQAPLLGVSALLACLGIGFLVAAKIVDRWYVDKD